MRPSIGLHFGAGRGVAIGATKDKCIVTRTRINTAGLARDAASSPYNIRMLGLKWRRLRDHDFQNTQALRAAVKSAEDAANKAASFAETAVRLIQELEEHQQEETPKKFHRLAIGCLCVGLAVFIGYWFLAPAFSHPSPLAENPGSVNVVIETPGPTTNDSTYQTALREVTIISTLDETNSTTAYRVSIPTSLNGLQFKILLAGSAVLNDLAPIVEDEFQIEKSECSGDLLVPNEYLDNSECQIFTGTVTGDPLGAPTDCLGRDAPRISDEYFEFYIWGSTEAVQSVDWAHANTTIPSISEAFSADPLRSWGGMAFDRRMSSSYPTACQELELSASRGAHEPSIDPDFRGERVYSWGPEFASLQSPVVVSEWRGSDVVGNVLLGVIGVLSTVLIGLISVTFRAWEAHQRYVERYSQSHRTMFRRRTQERDVS